MALTTNKNDQIKVIDYSNEQLFTDPFTSSTFKRQVIIVYIFPSELINHLFHKGKLVSYFGIEIPKIISNPVDFLYKKTYMVLNAEFRFDAEFIGFEFYSTGSTGYLNIDVYNNFLMF